jgi:hypothetical protein
MAAAVILKLGERLRFCNFSTRHAFLSLYTNLHQNRAAIDYFIARNSISKMAAAAILKFGLHFRYYEF